jgi:hypothetical protein
VAYYYYIFSTGHPTSRSSNLSLDAEGTVLLDSDGAGTEVLLQAFERLLGERP